MVELNKLEVDWSPYPGQCWPPAAYQLWALAAEDRQAPVVSTVERLDQLRARGSDIALYVYPHADHNG